MQDRTPIDPDRPPGAASAALLAPLPHAEVRKIFFGLMLGMFLAAINQTIVATALPTIGRDFADFENLPWIVTSFLLTSTAAAPLYGKLSDIHGRRKMMLTAIGIFTLGSIACALAPNMLSLILGRALQGAGGGAIFPVAQSVIADIVAPRERGRYQTYTGIVWVSAGVGGPVLGGIFTEYFHWSLIFWFNVPLGLIAAWLAYVQLKRLPRHDRKHKLDVLGAALMMAAAIPMLLALTWGGARYPWLSWSIGSLFTGAVVLWVLFAWRVSTAPEPFLPIPVLANPVVRWGILATTCAMGTSIALTIYVPLYYEVVHRLSASDSGLALITIVVMTTPGSIFAGRIMMYRTHYKWVPMLFLSFGIAALLGIAWNPKMPVLGVVALLAVVGIAIGSCYPVGTVSVQNAVARHQVGIAMGAMNFFRSLGAALLVAIMGAIVLAGFGAAPQRGSVSGDFAATLSRLGIDLSSVFSWVFVVAAASLALGIFSFVMMEEKPLRGPTSPTTSTGAVTANPGAATPAPSPTPAE
ncbi:MAG: MFS transporter [Rhizobiales bacterium]|nr:MFS transporter [Hyphomicrobiales bacterium]